MLHYFQSCLYYFQDEDEPVTFSGIIVPGDGGRVLSADNAFLYTATRNYHLNFDRVDRYSLFPGKVACFVMFLHLFIYYIFQRITIVGQAVKDTVNVEKIINPTPLQLAKLSNSTELGEKYLLIAD